MPSGASKGDYEAIELRDDDSTKYHGKGVQTAVHNVDSVIAPKLIEKGFDVAKDLEKIDAFMNELDGTDDKGKLGANAILGISMACARAGAAAKVRKSSECPCFGGNTDSMQRVCHFMNSFVSFQGHGNLS